MEFKDSPEVFTDKVAFLKAMPELRMRKPVSLNQLGCLCLTEEAVEQPPVKFQWVDGNDPKCRFSYVILAAQSYLTNFPDSITEGVP